MGGANPDDREWRVKFLNLALAGLFDSSAEECDLLERTPAFKPYKHQLEMLERGLGRGTPGIVTSGTGSGKTESFLLPILAQITKEARKWPKPDASFLKQRWWHNPETGEAYTKYSEIPKEKRPTSRTRLSLGRSYLISKVKAQIAQKR